MRMPNEKLNLEAELVVLHHVEIDKNLCQRWVVLILNSVIFEVELGNLVPCHHPGFLFNGRVFLSHQVKRIVYTLSHQVLKMVVMRKKLPVHQSRSVHFLVLKQDFS